MFKGKRESLIFPDILFASLVRSTEVIEELQIEMGLKVFGPYGIKPKV